MATMTVKNKRLKMSPGGIITLSVAARKALGMKVNEPAQVTVQRVDNCVVLSGAGTDREKKWRVSAKGQLELRGEPKELLLKSKERHYWLELDDEKTEARLMPF